MDRVKKGLTVSAAARMCAVPRQTLDDQIKGRVFHGTSPGSSTILSCDEEASLVSYVLYMAYRGFPLTRRMVIVFAWAIALRIGRIHVFLSMGQARNGGLGLWHGILT